MEVKGRRIGGSAVGSAVSSRLVGWLIVHPTLKRVARVAASRWEARRPIYGSWWMVTHGAGWNGWRRVCGASKQAGLDPLADCRKLGLGEGVILVVFLKFDLQASVLELIDLRADEPQGNERIPGAVGY